MIKMRRIALFKYIGEPRYIGFRASIDDGRDVSAERRYKDRTEMISHPKRVVYSPEEGKDSGQYSDILNSPEGCW